MLTPLRCGAKALLSRTRALLIMLLVAISAGRFVNYWWRGVTLPIPALGHPEVN